MNYIETVDAERTDLALHIDLCAQRYSELDRRLTSVEGKLDNLSKKFDDSNKELIKAFIATAGTILVAIVGLAGIILTKVLA